MFLGLSKETWAGIGKTLVGVVTVGTFIWAVWTYNDTNKRQTEAQAWSSSVEALREHYTLAAEHAQIPYDPNQLAYRRIASHALFTADTIDDQVANVPATQQAGWENTLKGLVADHEEFISSSWFPCDEFDGTFIDNYIRDNDKFDDMAAIEEALNVNEKCDKR